MAGIGFELKKLFDKKGVFNTAKAYGYATLVCAGPMLLGYCLLLISGIFADMAGSSRQLREEMVAMLTMDLLSSLIFSSIPNMVSTRFCADHIYMKQYNLLSPSFYGSCWMTLVLGGVLYGIFLIFSGTALLYKVINFVLFMTLIVVWTEVGFLNMLKDYKAIVSVFMWGVATALLLAAFFIFVVKTPPVPTILICITIGYMIMCVADFVVIYHYFPEGKGSTLRYLQWFEQIPQLLPTGLLVTLGLFGHLLIMWYASPLGVKVTGLFYGAPTYDVPAICAFFSILVSTVVFTTSVETQFYPHYREYFSLFNDGGSIRNIDEAEKTMVKVLAREVGYLSLKQLFSTLFFIVFGTMVLPLLPLGFTSEMLRIFRVLCVGYAFYALGNSIMLMSQYFSDISGAMYGAIVFSSTTIGFSLIQALFIHRYYGFGFLLGSMVFCIFAILRLMRFLTNIKYNVLSRQPVVSKTKRKTLTKMADQFDVHDAEVQKTRLDRAAKYDSVLRHVDKKNYAHLNLDESGESIDPEKKEDINENDN